MAGWNRYIFFTVQRKTFKFHFSSIGRWLSCRPIKKSLFGFLIQNIIDSFKTQEVYCHILFRRKKLESAQGWSWAHNHENKSTYYAFLSLLLLLFSMAKYNTSSPVYREYYLLSRHYPLLLVFTRLNLPLGISLWEYDSNCSVLWYIDNYKMTCVSPKFLSSQWKSNFLGLSQSCSLSYLVYTLFTFEYKKKLESELNGCFSDRGT